MILSILLACSGDFTGVLASDLEAGVLLGAHSDGDDAILVGGDFSGIGGIVHWNGDTLCTEPDPVDDVLWWVHGAAAGDWYAVGANGVVVHETGGQRVREDLSTTETLFGVFDDGTDVWAVSSDVPRNTGTVWRRQGGVWTEALQTPALMFKVWNGWFIGNGVAYFWDGQTFVERHPPDDARLTTIRGTTADDVYAVGGTINPVVLHWTNGAWETVPWEPRCGGQNGLNGIWTAPGEDVWVAGHSGTAASWDGSEWTCNDVPVTSDDFHFVWKHDEQFLFGGGDLFASTGNRGTVAMHPSPRKETENQACTP